MNDFCKGALEALFYAKTLTDKDLSLEQLQKELNSAITDLYNGIAIDFRERLADRRY
jgi:hypothetical protein